MTNLLTLTTLLATGTGTRPCVAERIYKGTRQVLSKALKVFDWAGWGASIRRESNSVGRTTFVVSTGGEIRPSRGSRDPLESNALQQACSTVCAAISSSSPLSFSSSPARPPSWLSASVSPPAVATPSQRFDQPSMLPAPQIRLTAQRVTHPRAANGPLLSWARNKNSM